MRTTPRPRRTRRFNIGLLIFVVMASPFLPRKEPTAGPLPEVPPVSAVAPTPRNTPSLVKEPSARESATVDRIVDGDTIDIRYRGHSDTVRFIGIDTPEKRDNEKARRDAARTKQDLATIIAAGKAATVFLRSILRVGDPVELEFDVRPRDKYNRILAYVYRNDGTMINEALVRNGYALSYTLPPDVRYADRFRRAEAEARRERRGLWR